MWSDQNCAAQGLKANEPSCVNICEHTLQMQGFFVTPFYLTVCGRLRNLPMKAPSYTELPEMHPFSIPQYYLLSYWYQAY